MQDLNQEFIIKINEKILSGVSDSEIRKWIKESLGKSRSRCNEIFNEVKAGKCLIDENQPSLKIRSPIHDDKKIIEIAGIRTLEELVEFSEIDLDLWEATKFNNTIWNGKIGVRAEFKKKVEQENIKNLFDSFVEKAKSVAPKLFKYSRPNEDGKLYILNLNDCHVGKIANDSETGWGDYNVKIAKEFYKNSVDELIKSAPISEIEKVILVVGSDLIHFDNEAITTSSGTRIEGDGTWHYVYNEACELIVDVVERLAAQFKVEVMVICGNHARLTEYALGSYVKAFFRNHPNVSVDNRPLGRKYFGWGSNLIGFTHSENTKIQDLPLIMMRENQKEVSKYDQFTFLTGHFHKDQMTDVKGVRVMISPALCPADSFHSRHGYIGNVQAGQGLLFADWGLQQIIYSKPPLKTNK